MTKNSAEMHRIMHPKSDAKQKHATPVLWLPVGGEEEEEVSGMSGSPRAVGAYGSWVGTLLQPP